MNKVYVVDKCDREGDSQTEAIFDNEASAVKYAEKELSQFEEPPYNIEVLESEQLETIYENRVVFVRPLSKKKCPFLYTVEEFIVKTNEDLTK